MKKSLLVLAVVALAAFGGPVQAETTVAGATLQSSGAAVQISEEVGAESYQVPLSGTFAGVLDDDGMTPSTSDVTCTLTANGIAATNPIPDDNPSWQIDCANADASFTAALTLIGGNRPLQKGAAVSGFSIIEIGGPIAFNGEEGAHGHVATCRGPIQYSPLTINMACAIL